MPAIHASWRSWSVSAGLFIDLGDGQGDREFPIVQLNMTFALNAVPTATVTIACGRELHTGAVSPIHLFAASLLQQRKAWIYVVLDEGGRGGDIPDIGLPAGVFGEIVFSGMTSGVGFQKSLQNGQVGYTLHLVHALAGLTFSSAMSDSSHPSNPSQYSWAAIGPTQSMTGVASAHDHYTQANIQNDFWGAASYPWLKAMTEEDGIQIEEVGLTGSGGNDGAAMALKLLNTAPTEYIPLALDTDVYTDDDVVGAIVSDTSLITQYPDRVAASTMWDIINGLSADYLFAIVQGNVFRHDPLGEAVERHDQDGDEEVKSAHYVVIGHWDLRDSKLWRAEFSTKTRPRRLGGRSDLGQTGGGCKVEGHSVIYSQMVDFFHYREGGAERPSRP